MIFLVAIENVFSNEKGDVRVGETPEKLLHICDSVDSPFVGVNIDVGHAYISSLLRGINIEDYFNLDERIIHFHVHNNYGIYSMPWDKHLPLFDGLINYFKIRAMISETNARNVILEVKNGLKDEILDSIEFLAGKAVRRCLV